MEEIKNSLQAEDTKDSPPTNVPQRNTADQYLYAVIKSADWIDEPCKKFAEKYRNASIPLRELYLCFCDKVPLAVLTVAAKKEPVEGAFRLCRRKHIESEILKEHSNELEEIKQITADMEADVKSMSGTVNSIAAAIPTLDEMFQASGNYEKKPQEQEKGNGKSVKDAPISIRKTTKQTFRNKNEEILLKSTTEDSLEEQEPAQAKVNFVKRIQRKICELKFGRDKEPAKYIVELMSKKYSIEQIQFILECMESGMTRREIERFADSKIPVELMKKLKEMQIREKEKVDNGK